MKKEEKKLSIHIKSWLNRLTLPPDGELYAYETLWTGIYIKAITIII